MIRSRPEPQIGDNSASADAGHLRALVDRILRLKEEQDTSPLT